MRKGIGIFLAVILAACPPLFAGEIQTSDLRIIGKTHSVFAVNSIKGPGALVHSLPSSYDMSLFEFNWGGKQSSFNGSGITTNANYPLTNGEAASNNTHIGLSKKLSDQMTAGFLGEFYTLIGNRTVGRVYGEELPWDNFPREAGAIRPSGFQADLYNAFLEGSRDKLKYKVVGGTLSPRELPEFTRKEMNQVKLGSLVYRAPITQASFFEKEDRKIEEGRHPLMGVDALGDYEYAANRHLHLELFTGSTEPTPISDIERDAYGGRAAVDLFGGNIGFTYVYNDGRRAATGIKENEGVWAVDSSYKVTDWVIPYFTFAQTDYERSVVNEVHKGNAYVAGALLKCPKGCELKGQYQRLEENYDLMAYHKTEHYPTNFQGFNGQLTAPVTDALKLKGIVYYLEQLDTVTTPADTIFGDSFFPSTANSNRGTIGVERLGADWKAAKELSLASYLEHAKFRKNADPISSAIDKDVYDFYGGVTLTLTKEWYLEGGFRHVFSVGNWQTMNFRSHQDIPEAAVGYRIDKEKHALLIYHYYHFEDDNEASQGLNDYHGHQVILEIHWPL